MTPPERSARCEERADGFFPLWHPACGPPFATVVPATPASASRMVAAYEQLPNSERPEFVQCIRALLAEMEKAFGPDDRA